MKPINIEIKHYEFMTYFESVLMGKFLSEYDDEDLIIQGNHLFYMNSQGYQLNLPYSIARRADKSWKDATYDVINLSVVMGSGGTAEVFQVLGTLKRQIDDSLIFKTYHERILRKEPILYSDFENFRSVDAIICKIEHLHYKPAVYSKQLVEIDTYAVMRRMKGVNFERFLASVQLSEEDCFELTLNLLHAYKKQIHSMKLIHRDLKPANIIIDPNTFELNIIDYQSIRGEGFENNSPAITLQYASPEDIDGLATTFASDIFSLGRTIGVIWGAKYTRELHADESGFYINKFNFGDDHKKSFLAQYHKMTQKMHSKRGDIDAAINVFDKLRFERNLSKTDDPELKNAILIAHNIVAKVLIDLHKPLLNNTEEQIIVKALDEINDHPLVIKEFLEVLNMVAFRRLTSKEEIKAKIMEIHKTLEDILVSIPLSISKLQELTNSDKFTPFILQTIKRYISELETLPVKQAKFKNTFDDKLKLIEYLARRLNNLEKRIGWLNIDNKKEQYNSFYQAEIEMILAKYLIQHATGSDKKHASKEQDILSHSCYSLILDKFKQSPESFNISSLEKDAVLSTMDALTKQQDPAFWFHSMLCAIRPLKGGFFLDHPLVTIFKAAVVSLSQDYEKLKISTTELKLQVKR